MFLSVTGILLLLLSGGAAQEDNLGLWLVIGHLADHVTFDTQTVPMITPPTSPTAPPVKVPMFRPPPLPYQPPFPTVSSKHPSQMLSPLQEVAGNSGNPDIDVVRLAPGIAMRADDYRLLNAAVKFIVGPNAVPSLEIVRVVLGHRGVPQTLQQMLEYVPALQEINRHTQPPGGTRRPTNSDILLRALRYYSIQQKTLGIGTGTVLF